MTNLIQIPDLQAKQAAWEQNKIKWLLKNGTTFCDHFNSELYERIKKERAKCK